MQTSVLNNIIAQTKSNKTDNHTLHFLPHHPFDLHFTTNDRNILQILGDRKILFTDNLGQLKKDTISDALNLPYTMKFLTLKFDMVKNLFC